MNNRKSAEKPERETTRAQASTQSVRKLPKDRRTSQRRDVKLGYLIHDVSRMRRHAFDQLMKPYGVTRSQWWVLGQLIRQDGMTQTQLSTILDVGRASLGTVLDRLEAGGFIRRMTDSIDRRSNRIYLTKIAQELIQTMVEQEQIFNEKILDQLSPDDRDKLTDFLSSIKNALSRIVSDKSSVDI